MRQRSRLRLLAILLGLSMVAAACGDDDDDTEAGEDTDTTEADEGGESLAPELGDAAPQCEGETDEVLTIGGLLPQTGDLSFLGPPMEAGTGMAVDDVNAAGGVLGSDIEFLPGDSGDADPDVANPTVDAHLSAGADVILGAASSGISLNVIDKVTGACKIQFSPANTSPQFTDYDDDDLYFRTAPSDILQGQVLADLMVDDGVASAAILARQDSYGEGLLQYTQLPFEEQGGEVVLDQVYDPEAQSFEAEVDAVVSEDPDALVMIGFDESSRILSSLFEQGFTPDEKQIYLVDGNIGNALGEDFDEPGTLVGVRGTLPSAELTDEFRDRLLEVDPDLTDFSYSAEAYDAVVITALAAIAAESDDPAAVAAQINGITRDGEACETFEDCLALLDEGEDIDYNGPSGPQEFSQPGEPTAASFAIMSYGEDNQIDEAATEFRQASL
ncbi:MAG TPA: ABC transporter substrate-binding protein [Acidimicrobiales bacterium]|nr:ABC transporter substrate-binding protein [Acidimicrobiales bacterium]